MEGRPAGAMAAEGKKVAPNSAMAAAAKEERKKKLTSGVPEGLGSSILSKPRLVSTTTTASAKGKSKLVAARSVSAKNSGEEGVGEGGGEREEERGTGRSERSLWTASRRLSLMGPLPSVQRKAESSLKGQVGTQRSPRRGKGLLVHKLLTKQKPDGPAEAGGQQLNGSAGMLAGQQPRSKGSGGGTGRGDASFGSRFSGKGFGIAGMKEGVKKGGLGFRQSPDSAYQSGGSASAKRGLKGGAGRGEAVTKGVKKVKGDSELRPPSDDQEVLKIAADLRSATHWLKQIRAAELSGQLLVAERLFDLARDCSAQPVTDIAKARKDFEMRHRSVSAVLLHRSLGGGAQTPAGSRTENSRNPLTTMSQPLNFETSELSNRSRSVGSSPILGWTELWIGFQGHSPISRSEELTVSGTDIGDGKEKAMESFLGDTEKTWKEGEVAHAASDHGADHDREEKDERAEQSEEVGVKKHEGKLWADPRHHRQGEITDAWASPSGSGDDHGMSGSSSEDETEAAENDLSIPVDQDVLMEALKAVKREQERAQSSFVKGMSKGAFIQRILAVEDAVQAIRREAMEKGIELRKSSTASDGGVPSGQLSGGHWAAAGEGGVFSPSTFHHHPHAWFWKLLGTPPPYPYGPLPERSGLMEPYSGEVGQYSRGLSAGERSGYMEPYSGEVGQYSRGLSAGERSGLIEPYSGEVVQYSRGLSAEERSGLLEPYSGEVGQYSRGFSGEERSHRRSLSDQVHISAKGNTFGGFPMFGVEGGNWDVRSSVESAEAEESASGWGGGGWSKELPPSGEGHGNHDEPDDVERRREQRQLVDEDSTHQRVVPSPSVAVVSPTTSSSPALDSAEPLPPPSLSLYSPPPSPTREMLPFQADNKGEQAPFPHHQPSVESADLSHPPPLSHPPNTNISPTVALLSPAFPVQPPREIDHAAPSRSVDFPPPAADSDSLFSAEESSQDASMAPSNSSLSQPASSRQGQGPSPSSSSSSSTTPLVKSSAVQAAGSSSAPSTIKLTSHTLGRPQRPVSRKMGSILARTLPLVEQTEDDPDSPESTFARAGTFTPPAFSSDNPPMAEAESHSTQLVFSQVAEKMEALSRSRSGEDDDDIIELNPLKWDSPTASLFSVKVNGDSPNSVSEGNLLSLPSPLLLPVTPTSENATVPAPFQPLSPAMGGSPSAAAPSPAALFPRALSPGWNLSPSGMGDNLTAPPLLDPSISPSPSPAVPEGDSHTTALKETSNVLLSGLISSEHPSHGPPLLSLGPSSLQGGESGELSGSVVEQSERAALTEGESVGSSEVEHATFSAADEKSKTSYDERAPRESVSNVTVAGSHGSDSEDHKTGNGDVREDGRQSSKSGAALQLTMDESMTRRVVEAAGDSVVDSGEGVVGENTVTFSRGADPVMEAKEMKAIEAEEESMQSGQEYRENAEGMDDKETQQEKEKVGKRDMQEVHEGEQIVPQGSMEVEEREQWSDVEEKGEQEGKQMADSLTLRTLLKRSRSLSPERCGTKSDSREIAVKSVPRKGPTTNREEEGERERERESSSNRNRSRRGSQPPPPAGPSAERGGGSGDPKRRLSSSAAPREDAETDMETRHWESGSAGFRARAPTPPREAPADGFTRKQQWAWRRVGRTRSLEKRQ